MTRIHANQGHCYANQVMTRIQANQGHCYANQVVTRIHANQGHLCKTGQIYTENPNIELVQYSSRKGRKKENCKKTDKGSELGQGNSIPQGR